MSSPVRAAVNFLYQQSTGELLRDGQYVATGYSGNGDGLNNPEMQHVKNVGPIPCGKYTLGAPFRHRNLGPVCVPIIPDGHACLGRSAFFVHGDNQLKNNSASEGCIIMALKVRQTMRKDDTLEVVE